MTYVCVIAGIVLIIISVRILFKNFIFNFNASDNGFINVLLVGLILASIILSICSFYYAACFTSMTSALASKEGLDAIQIAYIKKNIPLNRTKMIAYVFIGYVSIITCMQILKKIHIKRSKEANDSNDKWDLNKF